MFSNMCYCYGFRRYAEPLLDILIAGGMLAPGGKVKSSPVASTCVLSAESTEDAMRNHIQVCNDIVLLSTHM